MHALSRARALSLARSLSPCLSLSLSLSRSLTKLLSVFYCLSRPLCPHARARALHARAHCVSHLEGTLESRQALMFVRQRNNELGQRLVPDPDVVFQLRAHLPRAQHTSRSQSRASATLECASLVRPPPAPVASPAHRRGIRPTFDTSASRCRFSILAAARPGGLHPACS